MKVKNIELIVFLTGLAMLACCVTNAQDEISSGINARDDASANARLSDRRGDAFLGAGPVEFQNDMSDETNSDTLDSTDVSDDPFPTVPLTVGDEQPESVSSQSDVTFDSEEEGNAGAKTTSFLSKGPAEWFKSDQGWFGREGLGTTLKTVLVMSVLTLAPAILLMTTSYVRISVVLLLLRQAIGAGQIPSNQIVSTLSVFLTILIMSPVGIDIYQKAVVPYSEQQISREEAFKIGQEPVRSFLWKQIERTGNVDMIGLFTRYLPDVEQPQYYEDVPWRALAPAFLLSELKTAFLIGFQIFLPFLVIDLVVSCVLVSTGMMMLPPAIVSLPFKLALFVMVDGWTLVVSSLMESFA